MIKITNFPFCKKFLYRVQKQDTLKSIAIRFDEDIQKIKNDNTIEDVYEGQILFIDCSKTNIYVVKPLDTLEKIAIKLETTKEELMKKNNVKQVYIGQKLEY